MQDLEHRKFYGLDHLRALAIVLVFFYHYRIPIFGHPEWLNDAAKFGWTGVDLFFVLSGFLIALQLFLQIKHKQAVSFKSFFIKRAFRIIPAFVVVIAIYFVVPFFHEREALLPLWRYLTFTQNFGLDLAHFGTFSHAWSLCVEEHFYLFLPIILIYFQRVKNLRYTYLILIVLFILGFFLRSFFWSNCYLPNIDEGNAGVLWYKYVYYPTYNRLDGLLVGVSIAAIYQFLPKVWVKISRFGNIFILSGILVLTFAYLICIDELSYNASVFGFPIIAMGYGLIVIGSISPSSILFKWNSKVTTFLATLSYGIYLSHKGMIHVTQILFANMVDPNSNLMLLICIFACMLAALTLNTFVEKPFLKIRQQLLDGSP